MKNKRLLLGLFFGIFLIIYSYNVLAAEPTVTLRAPVTQGNYSTTFIFRCNVDSTNGTILANTTVHYNANATLWYGWGSSAAKNSTSRKVANTSANQTYFSNLAVDISNLSARWDYSFICEIINDSDSINSTAVPAVLIDSVIPSSVTVNLPANNYLNYSDTFSGLVFLNATITDALFANATNSALNISSVYFNITNSAGVQWNISTATNQSTWWNATINSSIVPDGVYNITVFATDKAGNINSTGVRYNIIFDNSGPGISAFSCSPTSVNVGRATACTCTATDLTPFTYTYTAAPAVSSVGTHTLTCTTSDQFALETSTTTTYSVTSGGVSSTASGGGAGTTTTWTNTLVVTNTQFEAGYTQELKAQERMKVSVAGGTHHVGVKSVTATSATIEITSDPVSVVLDIGEDAKVDVDKDGTFDLYVKLNSITNSKADVTVKKLSETVPAGTKGGILTSGEVEKTTTGDKTGGGDVGGVSKTWIYIIVGIVILVVVGVLLAKRKK